MELLAPPPPPSPAGTELPPADSSPSPLGYDFLDGLKVKPSEHRGKAVEGEGSEEAMAAFVELQRQVRHQRLEILYAFRFYPSNIRTHQYQLASVAKQHEQPRKTSVRR